MAVQWQVQLALWGYNSLDFVNLKINKRNKFSSKYISLVIHSKNVRKEMAALFFNKLPSIYLLSAHMKCDM